MKRWSISLTLVSVVAMTAWACGPFYVTPRDFVVYNLGDPKDKNTVAAARDTASWEAWCLLAGDGVRPVDVAKVMSQRAITQQSMTPMAANNPFARWLCSHHDALACLALAKQCQRVREFMQDPWYYPETQNDELPTIEEIEERALQHAPGEVQGRYVLTAVRAMMTQRKYESCLHYWDSVQSEVICKAVRDLIEPYVAGCRFRIGDYGEALRQFARLGDVRSVEYCASVMGCDLLDCARENPELPVFQVWLNNYLYKLDINTKYDFDECCWRDISMDMMTFLCQKRRDICLDVAETHPSNEAMWLYAAAAMSDALGETHRASELCTRALHARGHQPLDEKLQVLQFYVQARSMPMGTAYDAMVERGTRLLAHLTERDLGQFKNYLETQKNNDDFTDKECVYYLYHEEANYYWHNMLNRIVVGKVVPRLIEAGKTTRALMLCNMAENHLNHLMNAEDLMQRYDRSTFVVADTLSTAAVRQYRSAVKNPRGEFERWLVSRGYNRDDYWNELLGTKCLREMNYRGAVTYLRQVSRAYQRSMNIWPYLRNDPMRIFKTKLKSADDYKLHYAQAMLEAQQALNSSDANRRADALMQLAAGMANATPCYFTDNWALLRYGMGGFFEFGIGNEQLLRRQSQLVEPYKRQAFSTFTDREKAARWCYEWSEFRRVIADYPETAMASYVGTHCDQLRDYYLWKQRLR